MMSKLNKRFFLAVYPFRMQILSVRGPTTKDRAIYHAVLYSVLVSDLISSSSADHLILGGESQSACRLLFRYKKHADISRYVTTSILHATLDLI
jgi:hypothetical protein